MELKNLEKLKGKVVVVEYQVGRDNTKVTKKYGLLAVVAADYVLLRFLNTNSPFLLHLWQLVSVQEVGKEGEGDG